MPLDTLLSKKTFFGCETETHSDLGLVLLNKDLCGDQHRTSQKNVPTSKVSRSASKICSPNKKLPQVLQPAGAFA